MSIDQNDWDFELSFDSILPQNLDDLFFQSEEVEIPADAVANVDPAPAEGVSSWIGDVENFLMDDDDVDADQNHQISDLEQLLLSPSTPPLPPPSGDKASSDGSETNSEPERAETNADCLDKTQLRKVKNRDAAVRSRERRKTYVKELEMKSRYMEAELRRLDRLLQGCCAENHMLRVSLHNAAAFSGCMAKAESAVLLLESLLLGSLLWLMVTVCLLPQTKEAVSLQNANKNLELLPQRRSKGSKLTQSWVQSTFLSKRCSSSRTKMKVGLLETKYYSMFMMAPTQSSWETMRRMD